MEDGLKLMFKALIKVPIVVFIMYFLFNLLMFLISYVKIFTISIVVMFTGISNNYIPSIEQVALERSFDSLETELLKDIQFTPTTYLDGQRTQYGQEITVGVQGTFTFLNPLRPDEYNGRVEGVDGTATGPLTGAEIENLRDSKKAGIVIDFEYKVPGLKYYPDLEW